MYPIPAQLDHLVLAGPDLDAAIEFVEGCLGVPVLPGGRHPDWGTKNAIVPLSTSTFLEVIGPDPESERESRPTIFNISNLSGPRLVSWACKATNLADVVQRAAASGIEIGEILQGSRIRPEGRLLQWKLTDPLAARLDGVFPFFIDWGSSIHPASTSAASVHLVGLRGRHPDPISVSRILRSAGIDLVVERGGEPGLMADFQSPDGRVTLN